MADEYAAIRKALSESSSRVSVDTPKPKESFARKYVLTPLGNTLDVLDTDLNYVTNALRPMLTSINPKLNEVYDNAEVKLGVPNVVPSDLIEKSLEGAPGRRVLAPVLGFAMDVALSPTTYLAGIGVLTKEGKLLRKVKSLSDAGEKIALNSKIATELGTYYKQRVTPDLIRRAVADAKKLGDVPSLAAQADMGHRALINIGIPFTKIEKPFLKSQMFFRGIDEAGKNLKQNKAMKAFFKLFSTSSGNPNFDSKRAAIVGLARLRKENVQEFGALFGKEAEKVAKEYGLDRNEFLKMITDTGENLYRGDISAKAVLETFTTEINNKVLEGIPVERIIRELPAIDSMTMAERMKLHNSLLRNMKERAAGFNVHTAAFVHLPSNVRDVFVKEWTSGIGIKFAKGIKQGKAQFADFPQVFEAYNRGIKFKGVKLGPGEDAGMFALVGKDEYLRLIKQEQEFAKLAKTLAIPSGVGTEAAAMRDAVKRLVAHVDEGFATSYTLFRDAPEYLKRISPRMYKLQKLIDGNAEWRVKGLVEQFGIPLHLAKKYPKMFDLAQKYRSFLQHQLKLEQAAGVSVGEFVGDLSYIPHVPTEEARKVLQEIYGDTYKNAVRDWNISHLNTLAREFKVVNKANVEAAYNTGVITARQKERMLKFGRPYIEYLTKKGVLAPDRANQLFHYLSVSEVNNLAKLGKLKILKGRELERFFEENPAQQILIRGVRGEKARTSAEFYEAIRQFGKWVPDDIPNPEGTKFLKNVEANPLALSRVNPTTGRIERLAFDEGIAEQIDKVTKSLNLPPGSHPILNIFDRMQDEWKAWTLSIFPAYHTRNFIGNLWNNYLAGIHTHEPYAKALDIQKGKKIFITHGGGQTLSGQQVYALANKHGLINTGQFWGDIEKYFEADIQDGLRDLLEKGEYLKAGKVAVSKRHAIPRFGLRIGGHVENNAKLALFIRRLEEGYSSADAAMEVRKYLFDYRNITSFERNVLRRVIPFYSWTRFNIPLQLEAAFTHPGRLLAVQKGRNALETNYDGVPDERLLPDYFVQNFPIRIRYDAKNKQHEYFLLNSWLPAADIDKIFNPTTWIKNNLSPFMKEPIQQLANRDFFTDREIDSGDSYDVINILGKKFTFPARLGHIARNIRAVSEIDRLSAPGLSPIGKLTKATTGKLYPFEEDKQRRFSLYEFRNRRSKLKSDLRRARRKGNDEEAEKILNKLRKLTSDRKKRSAGR